MLLLNLGCGKVFHSKWSNFDTVSQAPGVKECDVRSGLPFADESIDICYSSHMIEHLIPAEAHRLLAEIFRILSPNGIIRIVVPDLELLVNNYLDTLSDVVQDNSREDDYDWTVIQLIDQAVRRDSGGKCQSSFMTRPERTIILLLKELDLKRSQC